MGITLTEFLTPVVPAISNQQTAVDRCVKLERMVGAPNTYFTLLTTSACMYGPMAFGDRSFGTHTVPEIADTASAPGSVLVVPVGSVEQHGYHLPTATDTILVSEVLQAALNEIDDEVPILVTPPVWLGYSPHHLPVGGTLSGEFATLRALLKQIVSTGLENGFDAALLLNGHGGNTALVESAVSEIGIQFPNAEILGLTYFDLAADFINDIRDSELGGMAHGGEFETSLMLHLHPELVKEKRAAEYLDEVYDRGDTDLLHPGPLSVYRPFNEYSESGAIGDPSLATAAKGEAIFEGLTEELASCLIEIHTQNQ